jgi:5-methylthioadenosine/S-adenosylhomocysteine deaminase
VPTSVISQRGTEGSNPVPSSGESTNFRFHSRRRPLFDDPLFPHHCSDAFILGCAELAREFDIGLHSHVAESKVQAVTGIRLYGKTQTAHLDELGVLGPHFTVAHGVWLDEEDMARLGDRGASVAHNPGSNMRLGSGLADARAMLERRVNLGIGTDGASCADNQNMYEAMRLASFVSKVQGPD